MTFESRTASYLSQSRCLNSTRELPSRRLPDRPGNFGVLGKKKTITVAVEDWGSIGSLRVNGGRFPHSRLQKALSLR